MLGARAVARSDADQARLAFHLASAEIASTLKLAIQHEEDLVVSASAFVTGNPNASAADFDRWAESVHAMQRYPELQNIGLVTLVPASQLAAFEGTVWPPTPCGRSDRDSAGSKGPLQILPPGSRPYYCFAVAGLARSAASYIPAGLDYCALAPTLDHRVATRGWSSYAPFVDGTTTTLGVETPVYRGGVVPPTVGGAPAGVRGMARRAARARRGAGAGARGSSEHGRDLPLRSALLARGVHERDRAAAGAQSDDDRLFHERLDRAELRSRRSRAGCSTTGTRSRC